MDSGLRWRAAGRPIPATASTACRTSATDSAQGGSSPSEETAETSTDGPPPPGGRRPRPPPGPRWKVHGRLYDLSGFIPRHPGGARVLAQSVGMDVTAVVESHHFEMGRFFKALAEFEVQEYGQEELFQAVGEPPDAQKKASGASGGELVSPLSVSPPVAPPPRPAFAKPLEEVRLTSIPSAGYTWAEDGFFRTVKRRVIRKLREVERARGVPASAPVGRAGPSWHYKAKVAFHLSFFCLFWVFYCSIHPFSWCAALAAAYNRVILTGIGHEEVHGRLGRARGSGSWLRRLLFQTFDLAFLFPSELWHHEHVLQHHPHTRRPALDPDEHLDPVMRLNAVFPRHFHHRFQAALEFLIGFVAAWGTWADNHLAKGHSLFPQGVLFLGFHLLPVLLAPTAGDGLSTALVASGVASCATLLCFHVSHIQAETAVRAGAEPAAGAEPPAAAKKPRDAKEPPDPASMDWGEFQAHASANWAETRWWMPTGTLDLQIEHHLFPALPYELQKTVLQPVVRGACVEFGVPYREYPSLGAAVLAHLRHVAGLGKE